MQHYIFFARRYAALLTNAKIIPVGWRSVASLAVILGTMILAACGDSNNRILPVKKAETGAPVQTMVMDSGSTSADFEELGGNSRAIRGAVANHYWTGVELLSPVDRQKAIAISGLGEGRLMATSGQVGYAPLNANVPAGNRYFVFQEGKQYYDMQMRKNLGIEALRIAEATVIDNQAGRATLRFDGATREIKAGDLLLPARRNQAHITVIRPQIDLSGRIIATVGDSARIGPQQVVTLNMGDFDNVKPGHLLGAYLPNTTPSAATMIGELVVVRVYGTLSYAVVTRVRQEIPIGSQVTNPATSL